MSNWDYANDLPSFQWRNAMTMTRELSLKKTGQDIRLASLPIRAYDSKLVKGNVVEGNAAGSATIMLPEETAGRAFQLSWRADAGQDFSCHIENGRKEVITVGYDAAGKSFYINRNASGVVGNAKNFQRSIRAPRFGNGSSIPIRVVVDASSIEVFADDGLTVMTTIFFPSARMDRFRISGRPEKSFQGLRWDSFGLK